MTSIVALIMFLLTAIMFLLTAAAGIITMHCACELRRDGDPSFLALGLVCAALTLLCAFGAVSAAVVGV